MIIYDCCMIITENAPFSVHSWSSLHGGSLITEGARPFFPTPLPTSGRSGISESPSEGKVHRALSFSVFVAESQVTSESSPTSSCRSRPHNVGSCWPGWGRLCDSAHASSSSSSGASFPGMKVTHPFCFTPLSRSLADTGLSREKGCYLGDPSDPNHHDDDDNGTNNNTV